MRLAVQGQQCSMCSWWSSQVKPTAPEGGLCQSHCCQLLSTHRWNVKGHRCHFPLSLQFPTVTTWFLLMTRHGGREGGERGRGGGVNGQKGVSLSLKLFFSFVVMN